MRTLAAIAIAVALFLMPAASPPVTEALGKLIGNPQNLSNTSSHSESPQISSGSDVVGVSWGERNDQRLGTDRGTLAGSFDGASFINATGVQTKQQWPDIAVDSAGTMHLAYSISNSVYYRIKPKGGNWSAARTVAGSTYPNPVRIAVGGDGQIWIVWRNNDGSSIFYRHGTDGVNWSGGTVFSESGNMFSPDVAVGTDNNPHVVWYIRTTGSHTGEIRIADWNGSGFNVSSVTSDGGGTGTYDADPSLIIDGQNTLHVAWRKRLDEFGKSWAITYARRLAGQSWTDFTPVAVTNGDAQYSPAIGTDEAGNLYLTYSNPIGSKNRQITFYGKTPGGSWDGPVALPNVRWDSFSSVTGRAGIAHLAYETEQISDQGEIMYARIDFASGPTLGAQPVIESGVGTTNKTTVSVSFTNITGSPKEVRWRWGAAPTDSANDSGGWQTFTNPKAIALPAGATSCSTLTLFTQVKDGTTIQNSALSDSIRFDNAVQANVEVLNPHLGSLPATFVHVSDNSTTNASDGDPNYTREPYAFLRINDAGDCSGLASFTVPTGNPSPPPAFTNGKYQGTVPLPQINVHNGGGTATLSVVIADGAGNLNPPFNRDIIYDPASTDYPTMTNQLGLPVVHSASVSADSGNSVVQTLSFSNVNVTDNVYGRKEGLPSNAQFWGLWIANATTDVGATSPSLQWFPVRVSNPGSSFTVQWSIFSGLNIGPDRTKPGTYFVYVRFLDGAGNPSLASTARKVQVQLTTGYTIPTNYLPFVHK